jgi:hypothetical protein
MTFSRDLLGPNITFSPFDTESGNAVISTDEPDGPYWTLIAQGGEEQQNAVAAEIVRRLNAPLLQNRTFLDKAIYIAAGAHNGQIDKGGSPYIHHCLRVMAAVEGEDAKIVAVLHDLLEDCPDWTSERLHVEGFPPPIIDAIAALTRGDDETYSAFIRRIAPNPLARRVKLADLADNMDLTRLPNPGPGDRIRLQRYERAVATLQAFEAST